MLVDGNVLWDVGQGRLRDRQKLANDGVVTTVVVLNERLAILQGPAIVSKGFAILLVVVFALLARYLLHRAIARLIDGATSNRLSRIISRRTRQPASTAASRSRGREERR